MEESGLVTVLFTDLVGSTELSDRIGDGAADDLRRRHFESLRSVIATTGGDEVKTIGDAVMVTYRGAADAIAGAVGAPPLGGKVIVLLGNGAAAVPLIGVPLAVIARLKLPNRRLLTLRIFASCIIP